MPESVDDVVAAVDYARTVGLGVAVQARSRRTHDLLDGTLLIDTVGGSRVEIDADARVAPGRRRDDLDRRRQRRRSSVDLAALHSLGQTSASSAIRSAAASAGSRGSTASPPRASSRPRSSPRTASSTAPTRGRSPTSSGRSEGGGGSFGVVTEVEIALYPVAEAFAGWLILADGARRGGARRLGCSGRVRFPRR